MIEGKRKNMIYLTKGRNGKRKRKKPERKEKRSEEKSDRRIK
jgi:hypothetical protein